MTTSQRTIRYLTTDKLSRFRRFADGRAVQALQDGAVTAVRSWALLDSLLSFGLRASEVAISALVTASWATASPP